jgi:hypothetical protein
MMSSRKWKPAARGDDGLEVLSRHVEKPPSTLDRLKKKAVISTHFVHVDHKDQEWFFDEPLPEHKTLRVQTVKFDGDSRRYHLGFTYKQRERSDMVVVKPPGRGWELFDDTHNAYAIWIRNAS